MSSVEALNERTPYSATIEQVLSDTAIIINNARMTTKQSLLPFQYKKVRRQMGLISNLCNGVMKKHAKFDTEQDIDALIFENNLFILNGARDYRSAIFKANELYVRYNDYMIKFEVVKI